MCRSRTALWGIELALKALSSEGDTVNMKKTGKYDLIYVVIDAVFLVYFIYRAVERNNIIYYFLAAMWLVVGVTGVIRIILTKRAEKRDTPQTRGFVDPFAQDVGVDMNKINTDNK